MADSFIRLPSDSSNDGKKVRTKTRTVGSDEVHEHMFNLVDPLPAGDNNIGNVDVVSMPATQHGLSGFDDYADVGTGTPLSDGNELQTQYSFQLVPQSGNAAVDGVIEVSLDGATYTVVQQFSQFGGPYDYSRLGSGVTSPFRYIRSRVTSHDGMGTSRVSIVTSPAGGLWAVATDDTATGRPLAGITNGNDNRLATLLVTLDDNQSNTVIVGSVDGPVLTQPLGFAKSSNSGVATTGVVSGPYPVNFASSASLQVIISGEVSAWDVRIQVAPHESATELGTILSHTNADQSGAVKSVSGVPFAYFQINVVDFAGTGSLQINWIYA